MATPKTRKAYCYDPAAKKAGWQDVPVPELPENFILVKVVTASINPLDLILLQGVPFAGFGIGPGPHIIGTQGAGIVVAHGPGKGAAFLNKKVAMMPSRPGTWTDYAVIHINDCIILNEAAPWEDASCAMAQPLTALMFLAMAKKMNTKAVVSTAASSPLGRIVNRLLQANGIEVINLVRKAEKAAQLAADGARLIINTSDADWEKRYVELCMKSQVGLVLDCVGGEALTKLAALSPPGSTICAYGSLSAGPPIASITLGDLYAGKILIGATVFHFWATLHSQEKVTQVEQINTQLGTTFKTNIIKTVPFASVDEALKLYEENKKGASVDGKIVLKW